MRRLRAQLNELAESGGLAAVGVSDAAPFADANRTISDRVEAGQHGSLRFTFADPDTATDVRTSYPWAERLVVASRAYLPDAGSPTERAGAGTVARFAVDDPYEPLRVVLNEMAAVLKAAGHRAEVLVDDNRLVDRAAARRAGIAWQGKSTMMLDPRNGPWIVLGTVVTDAPLEPDELMIRGCGTCDACIPACPTGAIIEPGVLDARLCLAAWAQTSGIVPHDMREAMGDRLYGCDDCLDACPPGHQLLDASGTERGGVDLAELLATPDDRLRHRFEHFYLPKNDPDVLRRNALIVLGNQADESTVGVLAGYLGHSNPVLRAHAAWALGRIDIEHAYAALRTAAESEEDVDVRGEIELALA